MKCFRTSVVALTALGALAVGPSASGQTTTAYNFLRTDVGARSAALAGSVVAITNDPTLVFANPASLATLDAARGSVGFFKHLLDINAGYVVYGQDVPELGHFGAGIMYTNYGSFDETDDLGNMLGTFTASDLAFTVGYGNSFDGEFFYGAAVKFIHSNIAGYRSTGLAADAGVLYVIPDSRVTLGASIRNLGAQLSTYAGVREPLPSDLTVGVSVIPRGLPLLFNLNFHKLNENPDSFIDRFRAFTVGGEFTLSRIFQLRFGYNNEQRKDLKIGTSAGMAGFSAGLGVAVSGYTVDYGLTLLGQIGSLHRISVSTSF